MSQKWGIDWKKPTTYAILAFIVLLFFMFGKEAKAETQTSFELAPTLFVAGDRYNGGTLFMDNRFADERWSLGLGLTTTWECPDATDCKRGNGPTNQGAWVQRVVHYKKFEMGLGISYWFNQGPAWNSNTPFALHLGWDFNDNWGVKWRHFSTGGSSTRNGGLDYISVSYSF